ncbi:MAG: hypothetical protein MI723_11010 [Caulobacterales bacterium]|nr:hypothetical protein [Caulobacterales bacterium]
MRGLLAAVLLALLAAGAPAGAQISREGGPIDITADESEFLDSERISRWSGSVDVRQGSSRLLADRMDVFFSGETGGGPGRILRIEAVGSVRYITPEENARADRGVYVAESQQIEMCGNVTLVVRGTNTLAGECLIVEPEQGRSRIIASVDNRGDRAKPRVRGVFYPSDYGEGDAQR